MTQRIAPPPHIPAIGRGLRALIGALLLGALAGCGGSKTGPGGGILGGSGGTGGGGSGTGDGALADGRAPLGGRRLARPARAVFGLLVAPRAQLVLPGGGGG
ncbi:MAG: hypothetical protein ACO37C_13185, partial [Gemmobacter sp.]